MTARLRSASRVLLVWTRLIMPNGRSIILERQPGANPAGYAGLEDEVENHWGALFKAALLSTLLGVGRELGTGSDAGDNGDIIRAFRRGSSDSVSQTGQKGVQRNLNIQPTLTIRPGFPVRVIVNRDLVLPNGRRTTAIHVYEQVAAAAGPVLRRLAIVPVEVP